MSVSAAFLLPTPPLTPLTSLFPHRHLHLHRPVPLRPLTAYNSLNAKPSAPRTPRILPPYLQSLQPYLVAQRPSSSGLLRITCSRRSSGNAVLNAVCEIRVRVYGRGLERDLGFFEGRDRGGVEFGDVEHRIAAEAEDVSDTIYAALNTVVPTAMQVAALSMHMVAISPCLLVISTAVSIQMNFYEYRKTNLKVNGVYSGLMAYVKKVLPSVLFVKANNAELCEITWFKRLAYSDRAAHLRRGK
ncbi:hypothetical protein MLD38_035524 [Melastoma candidum]|uniref:Uncharacterized protein n=1 Tax=Melastoma candidum TaxID=119954 RepID=A0ACB9LGW2_9MYRT|nr:hypothetical protein MLD38_035524 [Melastoma candidum]